MPSVVWSAKASRDLYRIAAYIRRFDPVASKSIEDRLYNLGESLTHFPDRGRPATRRARELVTVPPYVLRYRVEGDTVLIVRIRHGRQRPLR